MPPGFGTRDGGLCHCSRCLRRSGPLTESLSEVTDGIENILADAESGDANGQADEKYNNPQPNSRLHELAAAFCRQAERGDAQKLRQMLDALPSRMLHQNGETQLDVATMLAIPVAQHGHAHIIHLLDEYGAEWEEIDASRGGPALMHAANNGHSAAVTALLECGADPEAIDFLGQTALMVAIFSDRAGAAEALLTGCGEERRAFVDTEDDKGRTALSHAARYGSLDSIAVLAQHQADMFHQDTDGRTPLDIADECGRLEAAMQLRRLQQRQRLRERREANRAKDVLARGPGGHINASSNGFDVKAQEAAAAANAQALLAELEEDQKRKVAEAEAKRAKKERRQDVKKKATPGSSKLSNGKVHHPDSAHASHNQHHPPDDSDADAVALPAPHHPSTVSVPSRRRRLGKVVLDNGALHDSADDAAAADASAPPYRPGDPGHDSQAGSTADGSTGPGEASSAAASQGSGVLPLTDLRQRWDELLTEAASTVHAKRQRELLPMVQDMAEQCAANGISIKYGKKVIGRLERVGPAREELTVALESADLSRLAHAVEEAKGLRSLLEQELLARAEAQLSILQRKEDAHAAALLAQQPTTPPGRPQPSPSSTTRLAPSPPPPGTGNPRRPSSPSPAPLSHLYPTPLHRPPGPPTPIPPWQGAHPAPPLRPSQRPAPANPSVAPAHPTAGPANPSTGPAHLRAPSQQRPQPTRLPGAELQQQRAQAPIQLAPAPGAPLEPGQRSGDYSLFGGGGGMGGFPGVRLDEIKGAPLGNGAAQAHMPPPNSAALPSFPGISALASQMQAAFPAQEPYVQQQKDVAPPSGRDAECHICMSAVKDICCIPCGHVSMCSACAEKVHRHSGQCPLCRSQIQCLLHLA